MLRSMLSAMTTVPLLLGACQTLEFEDARLVDTAYDPGVRATRVVVRFQLIDSAGLPVSDLEPGSFTARENGVRAGEEAMPQLHRELHPLDVVLLLDRSSSVYQTGLISDIKSSARSLISGLSEHPCTVHLYAFARTVTPLESLTDLPDESNETEEHWTSLYHAVSEALDRHPGGILVVLTDGADNYSHNLGAPTLEQLAERIREDKRIVHAIGFGNIETQQDRAGVSAPGALRTLARYGSYVPPAARLNDAAGSSPEPAEGQPAEASAERSDAPTSGAIDDLVAQVARRIPATYTYEFYSPNLAGEHTLRIEAEWNGVRGTSPPIVYRGAGPGSGEGSSSRERR